MAKKNPPDFTITKMNIPYIFIIHTLNQFYKKGRQYN